MSKTKGQTSVPIARANIRIVVPFGLATLGKTTYVQDVC